MLRTGANCPPPDCPYPSCSLQALIDFGADMGVESVVIGMPHRGGFLVHLRCFPCLWLRTVGWERGQGVRGGWLEQRAAAGSCGGLRSGLAAVTTPESPLACLPAG